MNDKVDIKDEIRTMTKSIMPKRKKHRAEGQMTLGSLIKALNKERTGLPVLLSSVYQGYDDTYPGTPHSYYGYHTDLAFTPETTEVNVAQFLEVCKDCLRKSFVAPDDSQSEFYRDHILQANTPVWISKLDEPSRLGIIDVIAESNSITLKTEEIKEEVSDAIKP